MRVILGLRTGPLEAAETHEYSRGSCLTFRLNQSHLLSHLQGQLARPRAAVVAFSQGEAAESVIPAEPPEDYRVLGKDVYKAVIKQLTLLLELCTRVER
jgi:hypothetical protein